MSSTYALRASDRVLILAPHPDDETLATGGLIQTARELGCALRVIFATDGDNNPWPQRWLEKRWRIGPLERARWAQRRRSEAIAATRILGVDIGDTRALGWPDLELTGHLLDDSGYEQILVKELIAFAPTLIVLPQMLDRHPDHSALRVMSELALTQTPFQDCRRLGYMVHGPALRASTAMAITATQQARKQQALLAHASQVALSRKRLMRLAERVECFAISAGSSALGRPPELCRMLIPFAPARRYLQGHALLLVLATTSGVVRARVPLPRISDEAVFVSAESRLGSMRVRTQFDSLGLHVHLSGASTILHGYAKIERNWPRLVIYDDEGWRDIRDWINTEPANLPQAQMSAAIG